MGGPQLGGFGAAMGMQRQGSMDANSPLQRRHSQELHGGMPGSMAGPDMLPRAVLPPGTGRGHSFRRPQMVGSTPDGFAGGYPSATQRHVWLDSALPVRGSRRRLFINGHHPFSMDGNDAAMHARQCSGVHAPASMSGRSSMEMPGAGLPEMFYDGGRMDQGRGSLDVAQHNSRGSMELPPLRQRTSFDAASARAAAGNGYGGGHGRRPARHSIDLGAVQRQVRCNLIEHIELLI